jgi:tetratricopeptide (TPR) repeat protein
VQLQGCVFAMTTQLAPGQDTWLAEDGTSRAPVESRRSWRGLITLAGLQPAKQSKPRSPRLNARQRWTFRVLASLSPVLLLAVLEIFLRLSGYGYAAGFFVKRGVNGREMLTDNAQFGWRFFPKEMARTPQPILLSPRKEPGTTRVFVFGESAAMGDPEPSFGLPRMLQAMLELSCPSNRFEVLNVAMTAINSHVVREIAKDCAPLEGDVWVIYMGNNEVVGPFGSGTIFGRQVPGLGFIRATLWMKRFRVVQLLGSFGSRDAAEWQGMEMFLQQQVPRDDPRMKKVYAHFRENLKEIVRIGSDAGAKVLVGTVAVNQKDCPPFASQHNVALNESQRAEFARVFKTGLERADRGALAEAHAAFSKAQQLAKTSGEDHFAEVYFHLARGELALRSNDAARVHFNLAKEFDTLRFRADDGINDAIRASALRANGTMQLVDTASALAAVSSNAIPGAELFYEHVHLTFEGSYLLARAFFEEVVRALNVTPAFRQEAVPLAEPGKMPGARAMARVPAMEDCARRLGWTDWNRLEVFEEVRRRLQQPPFTAQFGHQQRDREWERRIDQLARGLTPEKYQRLTAEYQDAVRRWPDDWVLHENFAKLLEASGDATQGVGEWKEVMRLLPHDTQAHYHVGNLLDSLGRSEQALPFLREAVRRNPRSVESRSGLALALASLGRTADAERELNVALRLKPKFSEARVNLGQLLAAQGKIDAAMAQYELALKNDTNSAAAHVNLGKLLNQRGDKAGAIAHYQAALRISPSNAVAHYNLGNALLAQNPAAAARHYEQAVRAKPDFAEAHLTLALELVKTGKTAEAQKHFAEAVRLQPNSAEAHFNYGVLLANEKRFAEAAKQFAETLKIQPGHQKAREFLDRVERMKSERRPGG